MNKTIGIIGGDLRNVRLAELFSKDKNNVMVYGMEENVDVKKNDKILKSTNAKEVIGNSDFIIGPIPFSKEEGKVFSPISKKDIEITELINGNYKNKVFIAGSISDTYKKELEQTYKKVIDLMENEELTILNTIATAEGTIEIAINNTENIIHGMNVLILGFGRVGKVVAYKFKGLSCNVTCVARKEEDLAWAQAFGYDNFNIKKLYEKNNYLKNLNKFDIIINTIPVMIINEEQLKLMKKDVLLIDLASKPGGFDKEAVQNQKLKLIWAQGIPGKIAPKSSANFLKQAIIDVIKNELI